MGLAIGLVLGNIYKQERLSGPGQLIPQPGESDFILTDEEEAFIARSRELFLIEEEVKGAPSFTTDEFELRKGFSVKDLCGAIEKDGYGISMVSPRNSTEWLNELLERPGFYAVWAKKGINPLLQPVLPAEVKELAEKLEAFKAQKLLCLPLEQRLQIRRLNRLLLEISYPELCPKASLKGRPTGYMAVAFKDTKRFYLVKDGAVVAGQKAKKSELDPDLFGFLAGTPDDEVTMDFPIPVAFSSVPGRRNAQFDKKTPEGRYFVCDKGYTRYGGTGLYISYPNLEDAVRIGVSGGDYQRIKLALKRGDCPPWKTRAGGYIKGHTWDSEDLKEFSKRYPMKYREYLRRENPEINVVTGNNWTWGCLAFEISGLRYLLQTVPVGTPLVIYP